VEEKHMKMPRLLSAVLSISLLSGSFCAQSISSNHALLPKEPTPNLGKLKIRLTAYHDCKGNEGCYAKDLDRQADLAIAYLRQRTAHARSDEKLALVLDIDETSLSNWEEMRTADNDDPNGDDFGYIAADWNAWVAKKEATAIGATLRVYHEAAKRGVSVFFITSRRQDEDPQKDQTAATAENLKAVGYDHWDGLALRGPHPKTQSVTDFKSGERRKIAQAGYHIILNIGDQMSDLNGDPQAECSVKLPNPFYYIP
jgi:predicted secreted acid phosphatase